MLAVTTVATLAAAPGCASETADDGAAADQAEISSPGGRYGPALFRNDFYTYLKRDGHFSDEQIRQLVLMPTDDTFTARGSMKAYDDAFGRVHPTDFYSSKALWIPGVKAVVGAYNKRKWEHGVLCRDIDANPLRFIERQHIDHRVCWEGDPDVDAAVGSTLANAQDHTAGFIYLVASKAFAGADPAGATQTLDPVDPGAQE